MNRIFVTGDLHGHIDINKLSSKHWREGKDLSKDDYLIILGDFGLIWYEDFNVEEKYWVKWLNDKPWTTLFIDGNHENFNLLEKLPEKEMFGGSVGAFQSSIFHLKRSQVYIINNKKFLTIGGADSIDKNNRIKDLSWWPQEIITEKNILDALVNIQKYNCEVDYILTHCAPVEWARNLTKLFVYQPGFSEEMLSIFKKVSNIKFTQWLFAHYHNDIEDSYQKIWKSLYQEIIELK